MVLLVAVVIGLATAPLAGGRLRRIADTDLRLPLAPVVALVLQGVIAAFADASSPLLAAGHMLSYAVAGWFVVANRHLAGVVLLGLGGALNAVAIAANRGVMPASDAAVARAGLVHDPGRFHNSAVVDQPRLASLGDVFAIPEAWPASNVFSVGDVLLFVAAVVIVHGLAGCRWTERGYTAARAPRRVRREGGRRQVGDRRHSGARARGLTRACACHRLRPDAGPRLLRRGRAL